MECEYCDILSGNSKIPLIYDDDAVVVVVKDMVYTPGQITIFPRNHFTILEQVPDEIVSRCMLVADKVSRAVFEVFQAEGTNILIQNGLGAGQIVPHFSIEVIPRIENDNLNLRWDTKPLPEDEMETTVMTLEKTLQEMDQEILAGKAAGEKPILEKSEVNKIDADAAKEKNRDNYLLKSIRKIP